MIQSHRNVTVNWRFVEFIMVMVALPDGSFFDQPGYVKERLFSRSTRFQTISVSSIMKFDGV